MSQEIAVNTGTLASDIELLQSQLDFVKKDTSQMYEAMQALDAMWNGPANEAFRTQFSKDREDMETLCQTVQDIIDCMTYAKGEYNTCENEVGNIVAAIRI